MRLALAAGISLVLISAALVVMQSARESGDESAESVASAAQTLRAGGQLGTVEQSALEILAQEGDAAAMNVLGVHLWRSRTDRDRAADLFAKAAETGEIGARYNRALVLPDRIDTPPEIIQERLALLEANVAAGDVPSMVALGDALYFQNRDAFVPDRKARQRALFAQAAESGDADYLIIYGKGLWNDVRGGADAGLINPALTALRAASEAGDPRGAEAIGRIFAKGAPDVIAAIPAEWTERDPLVWLRRAGDAGLSTARCHYGLEVFLTGGWVRTADLSLVERHFRAGATILGNAPDDLARAIADLEHCATKPKRPRRANPPFGEETLYLRKLRGTYSSMANSPGWANLTLGVLYGYGIGVERDIPRALGHLDIAATRDDFTVAAELRALLPNL